MKEENVTPTEHDKQIDRLDEAMDVLEQSQVEKQETLDTFEETIEVNGKDLDELAEQLEKREQELFNKEVAATLRENGLEAFEKVIKFTDTDHLNEVVETLTGIVNDIKIGAGYVPKENTRQSEYDVYAQNKDTKNMIGSKLANFFKK